MAETAAAPSLRGPVLAAIAGCVDTIAFVGLHGLFAAHVTGNFVLIGAALVLGTGGILAKLATFPVFVLAVAAGRVAARRLQAPARPLVAAKALLLTTFMILGLALGPFDDPDGGALVLTATATVAAMGLQNALMRLAYPTLAPTTIMTGNTTGMVIDLVDLATRTLAPEGRARLARIGRVVLGFTLGCAAGAGGYALVGFGALLIPLALQALLLTGRA